MQSVEDWNVNNQIPTITIDSMSNRDESRYNKRKEKKRGWGNLIEFRKEKKNQKNLLNFQQRCNKIPE